MKTTKLIFSMFAILTLLFAVLPSAALAAGPLQATLIAGQNTPVGTVTINDDGNDLIVDFNITVSGYCLYKTHVHAAQTAPVKAAPGKFPYSHTNLGCATSDSYRIPLSELGIGSGQKLYIAAHADVLSETGEMQSGLGDLLAAIGAVSNPIQMTITDITPSGPARWKISISGAGALDGTYDGWCADPPNPFSFGVPYAANMSASLEPPWDKLNYIINHYQVGDISPTTGLPTARATSTGYSLLLHGYSLCGVNINQTYDETLRCQHKWR
jgi:hypothetical protein